MRETKLFGRVRPYLDRWGSYSRVENAMESGMWDIFYCINGKQGWIETKIEHSGKLYFEKFQLPWARKYMRADAPRLFVIAGVDRVNGLMNVYTADEVVKAPHGIDRKWTTVQVADLTPINIMVKPYRWDGLKDILVSS